MNVRHYLLLPSPFRTWAPRILWALLLHLFSFTVSCSRQFEACSIQSGYRCSRGCRGSSFSCRSGNSVLGYSWLLSVGRLRISYFVSSRGKSDYSSAVASGCTNQTYPALRSMFAAVTRIDCAEYLFSTSASFVLPRLRP